MICVLSSVFVNAQPFCRGQLYITLVFEWQKSETRMTRVCLRVPPPPPPPPPPFYPSCNSLATVNVLPEKSTRDPVFLKCCSPSVISTQPLAPENMAEREVLEVQDLSKPGISELSGLSPSEYQTVFDAWCRRWKLRVGNERNSLKACERIRCTIIPRCFTACHQAMVSPT